MVRDDSDCKCDRVLTSSAIPKEHIGGFEATASRLGEKLHQDHLGNRPIPTTRPCYTKPGRTMPCSNLHPRRDQVDV